MTINGTVPAPLIRLKEGQNVRLSVTNSLDEETSIHWHGLLVPFEMDGVPGVSFPGIPATGPPPPRAVRAGWGHWRGSSLKSSRCVAPSLEVRR